MTSIVGIRCRDGVVIGADGSVTFGARVQPTIEQPTTGKIEVIGDRLIVASTGYLGHAQRFSTVVKHLFDQKGFKEAGADRDKSGIEVGKMLSRAGIEDFQHSHVQRLDFAALVAYPSNGVPYLCELPGDEGFQPELRDPEGKGELWFSSTGSGRSITDPLLALFRKTFWEDGPPSLRGGIFTVYWALRHACDVNPGGIKDAIHVAVLERDRKGKYRARVLEADELAEHENMVTAATDHMRRFRDVLEGKTEAREVPKPQP